MPSYLYSRWPEVEGRLRLSLGALLILDYEGTLAPSGGAMEREAREALEELASRSKWASAAVIDSRTVAQLKELVGVEGLTYAGLDGMVISGPQLSFVHEQARELREGVEGLRGELEEALRGLGGVEVRDAGLRIVVSYARAPRGAGRRVARAVASLLSRRGGFRMYRGRRSVEVVPEVDWDRGRAVELLLAGAGLEDCLPIYVGDDDSDEPAFRSLVARGLTVVVGRRPRSYAKFYVRGVGEVCELIRRVARLSSPLG